MFPGGLNPRQMKQMMKRMGIRTEEIDANTVTIHGSEREIIIEDPEVMKMVVQGQEIFNITGGKIREREVEASVEIEEEDVEMVSKQANVSKEEARNALEESRGDIAAAIMRLKG
ncbi:MAG: nascent polypeptide-associated complex protein [Candidatus Altiarchaeales archaeon]|nr:MAG: nascent polypeptide-associated complex protein [Candidatus Altiarchaeales archaeon]